MTRERVLQSKPKQLKGGHSSRYPHAGDSSRLSRKAVAFAQRPSHASLEVTPREEQGEGSGCLSAAPSPEFWLFTDPLHLDRPYRDCELLSNYLSPILRRLGLKQPGTGWHTFRRSLASWMNAAGASTFDVRDQLGHSSVETTGIYVQTGDRRTQIIMALQDRFLGVQTMKGGVN